MGIQPAVMTTVPKAFQTNQRASASLRDGCFAPKIDTAKKAFSARGGFFDIPQIDDISVTRHKCRTTPSQIDTTTPLPQPRG